MDREAERGRDEGTASSSSCWRCVTRAALGHRISEQFRERAEQLAAVALILRRIKSMPNSSYEHQQTYKPIRE